LRNHLGKSLTFSGGKPLQPQSFFFQSQKPEKLFSDLELLRSPMIAKGVMAIAEMSPRPHHAICAFFECSKHMGGADPTGTHHPDQPHISRILHPTYSGCIRSRIRAPITGEDDDSGIKIIFLFFHNLISEYI
jgi:hypothetical protein